MIVCILCCVCVVCCVVFFVLCFVFFVGFFLGFNFWVFPCGVLELVFSDNKFIMIIHNLASFVQPLVAIHTHTHPLFK